MRKLGNRLSIHCTGMPDTGHTFFCCMLTLSSFEMESSSTNLWNEVSEKIKMALHKYGKSNLTSEGTLLTFNFNLTFHKSICFIKISIMKKAIGNLSLTSKLLH